MVDIPNIGIQRIGTGKSSLNAIKGFIELPCWTGYFLTEKPNYLIKTNVVANGRIDLWVDCAINADDSFKIDQSDIFKINKDNGTYEQLGKELKNKVWKLPQKKKMVAILVNKAAANKPLYIVYSPGIPPSGK